MRPSRFGRIAAVAVLFAVASTRPAAAQTYYWNPANTTTLTWDTTSAIWSATGSAPYTSAYVNTVPGTTDRFANFTTTSGTALTVSTTTAIVTSGITFGSNNFVIANGTGGSLTLSATTAAAAPTIDTGMGYTNTISAVILGTAGFQTAGSGKLILTGANTYSGVTTVGAGSTLQVGAGAAVGTLGTGTVTINGVLAVYRNDTSFAVGNALAGGGTINLFGTNTTSGSAYSFGGANSFSGNVNLSSPAAGQNGSRLTLSAATQIGGAATFNVASGSGLFFSGGTYTNSINIAGTGWTEAAGQLGAIRTSGGSTLSGPVNLLANARLTSYAAADVGTYTGPIGGAFALEFTGAGTINLQGAVNTGALTDSVANLVLGGAAGKLNGQALTVTSGSSFKADNATTFLADRFGGSAVTLNGGGVFAVTGNNTAGNNTAHVLGGLTVPSGVAAVSLTAVANSETRATFASLALNGAGSLFVTANTGTGITGLSGNGTTTVTGNGAAVLGLTAAPTTFGAGGTSGTTRSIIPGVAVLNGGAQFGTLAAYDAATSTVYPLVRGSADYVATATFAGVTANDNVYVNAAAAAPAGTTTMNALLINVNDVAGNAAGSVLKLNSGMLLVSDTSSGRSYILGTGVTTAPLALDFNGQAGRIVLSSSTSFATTREYSVNANVTNVGAAGLILTGSYGNTLGLRGLGNAQPSTTIEGVYLTGAVASPSTTPFQVNYRFDANLGPTGAGVTLSNAGLNLRGSQPEATEAGAFATFPATRTLTLTASTYTGLGVDTSDLLVFGGTIPATTATLTKTGLGTLALTAAPGYTGGTAVTAGTFQLGAGGTTGALPTTGTVALSNSANLAYARTDASTIAAAITGAGNLVVLSGTPTVTAGGSNNYTGDTVIYGGTLKLGATNVVNVATGGGGIYVYAGGTLANATNIPNSLGIGSSVPVYLLGGTLTTDREIYTGNAVLAGGTITGTNQLRLSASRTVTVLPSAAASTINMQFNVDAAGNVSTATLAVADGAATNDLNITKDVVSGGSGVGTTTTPAIRKLGAGTVRYAAPTTASAYTGATEFGAGTFLLDFSAASVPATNPLPANSVPLFSGGTFAVQGTTTTSAQTLGGTTGPTINAGGSAVRLIPGTGNLTLTLGNAWTRAAGGTLNVVNAAGGTVTSSPTLTNGILGYATVNGTDFATVTAGAITPYAGYVPLDGSTATTDPTVTYQVTDTVTVAATAPTLNGLKVTTTAPGGVLDLNTQTATLTTGGVLFTGANAYTIQNGTLATSTAGGDLIVHNYASGALSLNATLGTGASTVTFAGTGTTVLGGTQARTGATFLNGGTVQFSDVAQFGAATAPITFGGGTLQWATGTTADITAGRGTGAVTIGNGGATLDTNGNAVTLGTALGTSPGTLTKAGLGTLTLAGANTTFTGNIVVNAGTLATGTTSGTRYLGTNAARSIVVNTGGTLQIAGVDPFANASTGIAVKLFLNGGTLTNGTTTFARLGDVYLNGGTIATTGGNAATYQAFYFGTLGATGTLGANATVTVEGTTPSAITATGSNAGVHLGPNTVFQVADVTASTAPDLTVSAVLLNQTGDQSSAAGGLTKRGAGTILFSGANTFTGGLTVAQGTILGSAANAFGTGQVILGDPTTPAGSALSVLSTVQGVTFNSGIAVTAYTTGTVTIGTGNGTLIAGANNTQYGGTITLARDVVLQAGSADRTTFAGAIIGTGNVTVTSPITSGQRVVFDANVSNVANTYTGSTTIDVNAVLQLGIGTNIFNRGIPDGSVVNFGNAVSELRLTPTAADYETTGALNSLAAGAGKLTRTTGTGLFTLTVGGGDTSGSFSGTVTSASGTLALVKTGLGTQTLSGANTYTAGTTVSGGTLRAMNTTGSATGTGPVAVGTSTTATGTLTGTGTITTGLVTVATGSTLKPGDAGAGALTLTGGLTLNAGSILSLTITSATPASAITTGGSTTGAIPSQTGNTAFNMTGGTFTYDPGLLVAVDGTGVTLSPSQTYSYLVGKAGTQNLSALNITNPSQFSTTGFSGSSFALSLTGDSTGGVYLNLAPVPEPTSILACVAGGLFVGRAVRRRKATVV